MSRIFVPSKKLGFGALLPPDMDNPAYWTASSRESLEKIAQYVTCRNVEKEMNADIEKLLPVTQRLKERGIALHFAPKRGKFDMGGMTFSISAQTPTLGPFSGAPVQVAK